MAKIRRVLHIDSVPMKTRASDKMDPFVLRQVAKDSMKWLPYQRFFRGDERSVVADNANSSSDEDDGNIAAEDSGVEEESGDEEHESSQSGSDEEPNDGENMTDEDRTEWESRRRQTVLAFKAFATYSQDNVNPLDEIEAKAVKIIHKLIKKGRHWILTRQ
jgi:hypothetical protein